MYTDSTITVCVAKYVLQVNIFFYQYLVLQVEVVRLNSSLLWEDETELDVFSSSFPIYCEASVLLPLQSYFGFMRPISSLSISDFTTCTLFFCSFFFFYSCTISSLLCSFTLILCLAKIKKKRFFFACCVIDSVTVLKLAHTVLLAYIFLLKVFPQSAFIFPFQPLSGM